MNSDKLSNTPSVKESSDSASVDVNLSLGELNSIIETGDVAEFHESNKKKSSGAHNRNAGRRSVVHKKKLKPEPSVDIMRVQVETKIKKEILSLQKEAKLMMKKKKFSSFKFVQLIARIRKLRELLDEITYSAVNRVREIWIDFVKNDK